MTARPPITQPEPAGGPETEDARLRAELEALRAEHERLRESEKMYRFSAEIGGRLAWSTDPKGNVVAISRMFGPLIGIGDEEELKLRWTDSVHPDDRDRVHERWVHSLRTGEPFAAEFRGRLPDGSIRWALARAVARRGEDGEIVGWYGSTEDIDQERKADRARCRAEQQLRESEELHRFTLELTEQIVWSVESDGTGLKLSQRYYELTGMGLAEEPSLSIHPEDRDRVLETWAASLESGKPWLSECRLKTREDGYRYFRVRAAPLRGADGQVLRWYGMSEDIHEERSAEQAHRDMQERYRLAVQATNDAIWDYDVRAGTIERSDDDSPIGWGAEMRRTSVDWWKERIHPDDVERVLASLARSFESGDVRWSAQYRFRRADDSFADVLDRGFIVRDGSGHPVRAVGAMTDLTERNRTEAELRRVQSELIHMSRVSAMGTMASTLAHELNQPLAALSNYLSGARRLAAARSEEHALLAALDSAVAGAQRAGEIVRRLREHVSGGSAAIAVESLPRLIEEAGVLAFVDAEKRGVSHRLELDPGAHWIRADRIQVQQVLINLTRNAVEAMEASDRREILISTHATAGDMVEVRVADTGPGIAPEHFERLFSESMTTKSSGMGLGLPICRTIVEAHGGKIWAENREQGGALFRFTLPRASQRRLKKAG